MVTDQSDTKGRTIKICMKNSKDTIKLKELIKTLITSFGENTNRDGLKETPDRMIKMYSELLSGYKKNPKSVFKKFDSLGFNQLITVSNIDFYSWCEHHIIPFFGKVHIGYVPDDKILGLSKFARLVEVYARRLQTQENLTNQIYNALEKNLHPKGCIVRIEAEHLCVVMRGVKKKGFITKTTVTGGLLKKRNSLIKQFYKDVENK